MGERLVIVTGASKGIGKATVSLFLKKGYEVVGCSRNQSDLDKLKKETEQYDGALTIKSVDMSLKDEVLAFGDYIKSRNHSVDILVNNVGVFLPGNIIDEEDGNLEKQVETNLYSAYYLTRSLLPKMIKRNGGSIFNVCSTASLSAYANGSSYSISKYALRGFNANLREELKSFGIKVTGIFPGNVLTPSWGETDIPEKKFIKATDVAQTIYDISQLSATTDIEEVLIQPQFKQS
ncbi:MAG: SDR family oxidoreductase [Cyclobacteriaceae bacterium]